MLFVIGVPRNTPKAARHPPRPRELETIDIFSSFVPIIDLFICCTRKNS